jgi:hypothetical protein
VTASDRPPEPGTRASLLVDLAARLGDAAGLAEEMRAALKRADAAEIEELSARLETVALECRVLAEECARVPSPSEGAADGPELAHARDALHAAARRLARSAAFSNGLLERLITLRRALLAVAASAIGGSYESSGRIPEPQPEGVRLRRNA